MSEPFSLLLTVYGGDRADHTREAFRSAVDAQERRPEEVVLVQDGPVPADLAACLDELRNDSPVPVAFVPLERNGGLGRALDRGLAASRYDVVARMDADDIAMPHRFAVQLPLIERGADLVGAGMLEFGRGRQDIVGRRTPVSDTAADTGAIARYARLHDPFNHPTVVYRRTAVLAAGGYGHMPLMEDYWLFARMIAGGAEVVNLTEPLVYYRVGNGAYERRGGVSLLRAELRLQRELRRSGFTTRAQYLRNVAVRGGYRLTPAWLRRPLYRRFVAPRGVRRAAIEADAAVAEAVTTTAVMAEMVAVDRAVADVVLAEAVAAETAAAAVPSAEAGAATPPVEVGAEPGARAGEGPHAGAGPAAAAGAGAWAASEESGEH